MAAQNINTPYPSADAVSVFMFQADVDENSQLSVDELATNINNSLPLLSPPITGGQIRQVLPQEGLSVNYDNLAHFHVYYIIGLYLMAVSNQQEVSNLPEYSYATLVNEFNLRYDGPGVSDGSDGSCFRPNPDDRRYQTGSTPDTIADCRNCDDVEPIGLVPLSDIDPTDLMMLPSGNCLERRHRPGLNNMDPYTRAPLTGGKKRKSRKVKKKTKKRRKTRKTK